MSGTYTSADHSNAATGYWLFGDPPSSDGPDDARAALWQDTMREAELSGVQSPQPTSQHAPAPGQAAPDQPAQALLPAAGLLARSPSPDTMPLRLPPPAGEAGLEGIPAGARTAGPGLRLPPVLALPLMLKGDAADPHASLAGHKDLSLDLSDPSHVTISRNDGAMFGLLPGTKLTTLNASFHDTPDGVQGRVFDDRGQTLGNFHNGVLQLAPQADAALDALAHGTGGQPPETGTTETAGCEEPAKGEPGRTAGREPLAQRDPIPQALRADSARSRDIVRQTDPAIAAAGLSDKDWMAHHLITREAAGSDEFAELFDAASKAGWQEDSAGNLIGLPTNCPAQEKLHQLGVSRPEHVGSHPTWNRNVAIRLSNAVNQLRTNGLSAGSSEYNSAAKSELENVQQELRQSLGSTDRVTMIDAGGLANVAA